MGVLKPDREGEGAWGSWIQVPLIRGFPNTAGLWWMKDEKMTSRPGSRGEEEMSDAEVLLRLL